MRDHSTVLLFSLYFYLLCHNFASKGSENVMWSQRGVLAICNFFYKLLYSNNANLQCFCQPYRHVVGVRTVLKLANYSCKFFYKFLAVKKKELHITVEIPAKSSNWQLYYNYSFIQVDLQGWNFFLYFILLKHKMKSCQLHYKQIQCSMAGSTNFPLKLKFY